MSPHGGEGDEVESPVRGIIIGCSNIPVANEGEALFNVAQFDKDTMSDATESVGSFTEVYENKPYEQ